MEVSKQQIQSYQNAFKEDFGKDISEKQAYNCIYNLVGFYKTLAKIKRRIHLQQKYEQVAKPDQNANIKSSTNRKK